MKPQIESLEGRALTSVALHGGNLIVRSDVPGGNQAIFSYNGDGSQVLVDLNGQVATFNAADVKQVVYFGSQGGGDYVESDLNLIGSFDFLYGDSNVFNGSLGQDNVFLFGNGDAVAGGGGGDVIHAIGTDETILDYPDQVVLP